MDQNLTLNGIFYEENEKFKIPAALWLYFIDTPIKPSNMQVEETGIEDEYSNCMEENSSNVQ